MSEPMMWLLVRGVWETLAMTFVSGFFGFVIGLPVGVLLYVTSGIAECSFTDICRKIWPFIAILVITVLLCVAFPGMITLIPKSLM